MGRLWQAIGLASTLIVAGTTTAPARTTTFTGWVCVIDLETVLGAAVVEANALPREVTTTQSTKKCTGSAIQLTENIQINCTTAKPVDGLGTFAGDYTGIPCQVFQGQCGAPGFVPAQVGKLTIFADGNATLSCNRN